MSRYILISDVHGCLVELEELLLKVELDYNHDTVIFLGDLIDKGRHGPEVVKYVRDLSTRVPLIYLRGNHEDVNIRFWKHEKHFRETGEENPMSHRANADNLRQDMERMSSEDKDFVLSSILFHRIPECNALAVHAGIPPWLETLPENPDRKQLKVLQQVMRIRSVRNGKSVKLSDIRPDDTFWAELYDGRFGTVYYGHRVLDSEHPAIHAHSVGFDLGCVYGGWLCATILEKNKREFVHVKSKAAYYKADKA